MKYRILPKNEGQELNVYERFTGSLLDACTRASHVAKELQKLFPESTMTCGVQTQREGLRGVVGITAWPDGRFVNQFGDFIQPLATKKGAHGCA